MFGCDDQYCLLSTQMTAGRSPICIMSSAILAGGCEKCAICVRVRPAIDRCAVHDGKAPELPSVRCWPTVFATV